MVSLVKLLFPLCLLLTTTTTETRPPSSIRNHKFFSRTGLDPGICRVGIFTMVLPSTSYPVSTPTSYTVREHLQERIDNKRVTLLFSIRLSSHPFPRNPSSLIFRTFQRYSQPLVCLIHLYHTSRNFRENSISSI